MPQFCYLILYLRTEIVSRRPLLRMAKIVTEKYWANLVKM